MTFLDFFRIRVLDLGLNAYWCLRKRFPLRILLCDVVLRDIPASTVFGHPYGVAIAAPVRLGENCVILQNVTIGHRRVFDGTEPGARIGNNVRICAGAIILGPVAVGDGAIIGAGAVVLEDVPAGAVAVGNPARVAAGL